MKDLIIGGIKIKAGETAKINLKVAKLYDLTQMEIPVKVIRGKEEGPRLFISAALHGDEINGVEIIAKLLKHPSLKNLQGSLIVVPIVNVFGFNTRSRYLPDRRDLNRSFPGTGKGSLAAQIANIFMEEIVANSTHGIDLHCAATHRCNFPQVRISLNDHPDLERMAHSFGAPVIIDSSAAEGTLRAAVKSKNIAYMVFEGGEALRFDPKITKLGVEGILQVMYELGMLNRKPLKKRKSKSFLASNTYWLRAPDSGILVSRKKLGAKVKKNEILGVLTDAFGDHKIEVRSHTAGIIIGQTEMPLFNKGDAMFHVACFQNVSAAHESVSTIIDDAVV